MYRTAPIRDGETEGVRYLPVATTALHHFLISPRSPMLSPLSFLSSISSQLRLTVYLAHAGLSSIQPVSPGQWHPDHTDCSVRRHAVVEPSCRGEKRPGGWNPMRAGVTELTPQCEGRGFSPLLSSPLRRFSRTAAALLYLNTGYLKKVGSVILFFLVLCTNCSSIMTTIQQ